MRFKSIFGACGLGLIGLAFATPALAASATGDVTVKIIRPLSIVQDIGMDFGTLTIESINAQAVAELRIDGTVNPLDNLTASGSSTAAEFTVTGSPDESFSIDLNVGTEPTGPNSEELTLSGLSHNASSTTIPEAGSKSFKVKAVLIIPPDVTGGTYEGQYTVTVFYQ